MSEYSKAIVAAIMGVLAIINMIFGVDVSGITQDQITSIIVALTPVLVYLVRNKQPTP